MVRLMRYVRTALVVVVMLSACGGSLGSDLTDAEEVFCASASNWRTLVTSAMTLGELTPNADLASSVYDQAIQQTWDEGKAAAGGGLYLSLPGIPLSASALEAAKRNLDIDSFVYMSLNWNMSSFADSWSQWSATNPAGYARVCRATFESR